MTLISIYLSSVGERSELSLEMSPRAPKDKETPHTNWGSFHNLQSTPYTALHRRAGEPFLRFAAQVVLKLNGGLGTGMGLEKAKSLLPVKQGLTFLEPAEWVRLNK